jgi:hypothetical protein
MAQDRYGTRPIKPHLVKHYETTVSSVHTKHLNTTGATGLIQDFTTQLDCTHTHTHTQIDLLSRLFINLNGKFNVLVSF